MAVLGAIVALIIYFSIFGILVKDSLDQIRRIHREHEFEKRMDKRNKHWSMRV